MYVGFGQVNLVGNNDNEYYNSTPEDCQSNRVDNMIFYFLYLCQQMHKCGNLC